ncbi:hypothetical protein [Antribacter gilvus]|uniref:hypothetical protein n=1 Tax=Antribacter gilvus TaxID=2304675 RepID=UPI000F795AAA|nr:hypothetical protein [Antribacter gilvus]
MAPQTIRVTREDLLVRREALLRRLDVSIEDLRERARYGTLSGHEWEAISELREIGFLLDDASGDF